MTYLLPCSGTFAIFTYPLSCLCLPLALCSNNQHHGSTACPIDVSLSGLSTETLQVTPSIYIIYITTAPQTFMIVSSNLLVQRIISLNSVSAYNMNKNTTNVAGVEEAMEDLAIDTLDRPAKRLRTGQDKPRELGAPPKPIMLKFKLATNTASDKNAPNTPENFSVMTPITAGDPQSASSAFKDLQLSNKDHSMVPSVQSENDNLRAVNTALRRKVKDLEKGQGKQQKEIDELRRLFEALDKKVSASQSADKMTSQVKEKAKGKNRPGGEDTYAAIKVRILIPSNAEVDEIAVDALDEDVMTAKDKKEAIIVINGQSGKTLHKLWRTIYRHVAADVKESMEEAIDAGTTRKVEMYDSKDKADFTTTIGSNGSDRMYYEWYTRNVWNAQRGSVDLTIWVG